MRPDKWSPSLKCWLYIAILNSCKHGLQVTATIINISLCLEDHPQQQWILYSLTKFRHQGLGSQQFSVSFLPITRVPCICKDLQGNVKPIPCLAGIHMYTSIMKIDTIWTIEFHCSKHNWKQEVSLLVSLALGWTSRSCLLQGNRHLCRNLH
jgi:hypothetical protein